MNAQLLTAAVHSHSDNSLDRADHDRASYAEQTATSELTYALNPWPGDAELLGFCLTQTTR